MSKGRLNHCRYSGVSGFGGTMGGMRRSDNNRVKCPGCGKRIMVTLDGRLRAHGTRSTPGGESEA